jgi:hypothetical protein
MGRVEAGRAREDSEGHIPIPFWGFKGGMAQCLERIYLQDYLTYSLSSRAATRLFRMSSPKARGVMSTRGYVEVPDRGSEEPWKSSETWFTQCSGVRCVEETWSLHVSAAREKQICHTSRECHREKQQSAILYEYKLLLGGQSWGLDFEVLDL